MKLVLVSFFVILSIVSGCDSSGIENTGNFGSSKNQGSRSGSGSNQSSNNPVPAAGKTNKTGKNLEELEKLEELVDLGEPINKGAPKANSPTTEPIKLADNKQSSKPVVNPALTTGNPPKAPVANPAPTPTVKPAPVDNPAPKPATTVNPAPKPVVNPAPVPAPTVNPAPKSVVNPVPAANNPTPGPVANPAPAIAPDAKKIVDNIFNPKINIINDLTSYLNEESLLFSVLDEDEKTKLRTLKLMELINAGILAKIFDNKAFSEYVNNNNNLGNYNKIRVNSIPSHIIMFLSAFKDINEVKSKIINEIKDNNYIKKITLDSDAKKVFLSSLPNEIKNDPEIGRQIEIKLFSENPDYLKMTEILTKYGKNDSEKTKLAIELIDEGLITNLFNLNKPKDILILNEDNLAFNDSVKNKIIEKIKNDKIIENINYKNGVQLQFLTHLDELPDYLLNDPDIIKQIQMAISKNMTSNDNEFEAIYKIVLSKLRNEKINNLLLDLMVEFFDNVMKKDDKGVYINKDLLLKTIEVMKKEEEISNYFFFVDLKDKFKTDASKHSFYTIIYELINDPELKKQID